MAACGICRPRYPHHTFAMGCSRCVFGNVGAYLSSPRCRAGEFPIEQRALHVVDAEALDVLCPFEPVPVCIDPYTARGLMNPPSSGRSRFGRAC
jgi:hypothetical protein